MKQSAKLVQDVTPENGQFVDAWPEVWLAEFFNPRIS